MSSWAPLDGVPLLRSCFGALRELLPWLPFREGKAPLGDEQEFQEEMERAGFGSVKIHTVEHRVEVSSASAFWASNARSSAPVALLRKQIDPSEWEDVSAGVIRILEKEFGRGPLEMSCPARLGVGVRPVG